MRQIASYTVEDEPIARGGMGQIFRGHDSQGHVVAIKEILPEFASDWSILSRIEKEVEFLVKVDHPSIVKLYSAFLDNQTQSYFIVMEMVDGMNIEQYVNRNGPMSEEQAVGYMLKILDALQCVHNAHIVHRDIKPSNIMIRPNGSICLLDFGVAKDMDNGGGTIAGSIIGTNGYMSPEQADGYSINFRSDIYSLGCVFYFMLTGHHAFNTLGSDFETRDAIINNKFPRLSKYNKNASDVLQNILDKATAKNMMQRFQNCYEFIAALQNGTHVSHSGIGNIPVLLSVGREKCDIIINDKDYKVSRHHADIELKVFTGGRYYVFTDCSANGTVINGKSINKASVNIPADGKKPHILLAGVTDGLLDWNKVVAELDKRAKAVYGDGGNSVDTEIVEKVYQKPEEDSTTKNILDSLYYEEQDATVWLIAAYVFAILGGLLGIVFGIMVNNSKITLPNGDKVYKYKYAHRTLGLIAAILSGISMFVWKICLL